jgi:hypothetical protein
VQASAHLCPADHSADAWSAGRPCARGSGEETVNPLPAARRETYVAPASPFPRHTESLLLAQLREAGRRTPREAAAGSTASVGAASKPDVRPLLQTVSVHSTAKRAATTSRKRAVRLSFAMPSAPDHCLCNPTTAVRVRELQRGPLP